MRVYTYANPFSINKADYWSEIKALPQLCISQTLAQGMINYYGRSNFTVISTIQSFLNEFYKEWENSPENDIAQFVEASEYINSIEDEILRSSMRFNKKNVVEALRYCIEFGLEPSKFKELNKEQKEFLKMLEALKDNMVWKKLDVIKDREDADINKYKVLERANKSLKQMIANEIRQELELSDLSPTEEKLETLLKKRIDYIKSEQKSQIKTSLRGSNENKSIKNKIRNVNKFIELNRTGDFLTSKSIVIHGVHQFTPIILKLVSDFEKLGLEVIFLINYNREFGTVYNTWNKVYHHVTGELDFDKSSETDTEVRKELGLTMGNLLEGRKIDRSSSNIKFESFDNLTTFSDYVSEKYREAENLCEQGKNPLRFMSKQFYAVNSRDVNDMLKTQYPNQYGEKHFLSYPIGSFILGLYNMWNSETKKLEIDEYNLLECLSVGFWKTSLSTTPISIYDRVKLYFKDVKTLDEYIERIQVLGKNKTSISDNQTMNNHLSKMSIYSITLEEIDYLEYILRDLRDIAQIVFQLENEDKVDYSKHFRVLMEIILDKSKQGSELIDDAELTLVKEIAEKLSTSSNLEVKGSIEDLKEAIHYYLHRRKDDNNNSANWIVRDFEQIDGGVLLSKNIKNRTYHYAMLSDRNMMSKEKIEFIWPLDEKMIEGYEDYHPGIDLILTVKKEYKNFLRYSLFYGMTFLQDNIELSFIENSEGEKENPYFILKMMGITPKKVNFYDNFDEGIVESFQNDVVDHRIVVKELDREMFSICPIRYLYNSIMNNKFYFRNEFQIRYYYIVLLRILVWEKSVGKSLEEAYEILDSINENLKRYFPFWNEVDFIDIKNKTMKDLKDSLNKQVKVKNFASQGSYINKKLNFLMARYNDENGANLMNFGRSNKQDILNFLSNNDIFELDLDIPKELCQYCNQREVCLSEYVEGE